MRTKITRADEPRIKRWLNCHYASVYTDGAALTSVWVAGPMLGHWLKDDDIEQFIQWRAAQKTGVKMKR